MITGPLRRAARALTEISRDRLAQASGGDVTLIEAFERKLSTPGDGALTALQSALERFRRGLHLCQRRRGRCAVEIQRERDQTDIAARG